MSLPNLGDYHVPETTDDAIALLTQYGDAAMIVAGGTFVHGLEVRGVLTEVEALIDIGRLGLGGVEAARRRYSPSWRATRPSPGPPRAAPSPTR